MSYPTELSPDGRKALEVLRAARRQLAYYKQLADEARVVIEAELGDRYDEATIGAWVLEELSFLRTAHEAGVPVLARVEAILRPT